MCQTRSFNAHLFDSLLHHFSFRMLRNSIHEFFVLNCVPFFSLQHDRTESFGNQEWRPYSSSAFKEVNIYNVMGILLYFCNFPTNLLIGAAVLIFLFLSFVIHTGITVLKVNNEYFACILCFFTWAYNVLQGDPTCFGFFEFEISDTSRIVLFNFESSNFSLDVDIW